MNNEVSNEESIGKFLKSARKKMGFTKKEIANRLCLKISIIHDIEKDFVNEKICTTFLKGYITSYARLVKVPENEIKKLILNKKNFFQYISPPMQTYSSINKFRSKYNKFFLIITWIILLLSISITIIWYLKYYKEFKNEIIFSIPKKNYAVLPNNSNEKNIFFSKYIIKKF